MTDLHLRRLIAAESFLKTNSYVDAPFLLKGSMVTRQFFPHPSMRHVQDLDWVYLHPIDDAGKANTTFSNWVIKITEIHSDEKVWFRNFKENNFWRMIDYAMDDDFPTTNTDLYCIVDEEGFEIGLDISFNLELDFPPEKLLYKPVVGQAFALERVCPYCLQVSWKLHQLLVRPRQKDIFDLIHLLRHERFNQSELEKILYALKKECKRDGIEIEKLLAYIEEAQSLQTFLRAEDYKYFTSKEFFPYQNQAALLKEFQQELIRCGFTRQLIET